MRQLTIDRSLNIEENAMDFEKRTGLPNKTTRANLEKLGARYLSTEPFVINDEEVRYEQMQYERDGNMYMWRRIVSNADKSDRLSFEIHLEIDKTLGVKHYKSERGNGKIKIVF